jgi:HAD superfamily hydrolase (TIGR01490 family)
MKLAFYDLDGTLVSSNVVTQYAWYARREGWGRLAKLLGMVPFLFVLDLYSRSQFNVVFYREYAGMRRDWLEQNAGKMFEAVLRPAVYPGALGLVARDKAAGFRTVLVTGSLDFALASVVQYFGFDELICNRLEFRDGIATGRLAPPLIAEHAKVEAMRRLCAKYNVETMDCKAYSDSISDLPMLEAVGHPAAANPGRRLRRLAEVRGWPVVNLRGN